MRTVKLSIFQQNTCQQSCSTQGSQSQNSPRLEQFSLKQNHRKQKLQLCRKYMDFGYCPYQKKCKFAHGSHELRRNDQMNIRYKTKECGVYFNKGSCGYGNRCNFLHRKKVEEDRDQFTIWKNIKTNFRELIEYSRSQSRITKLFQ